jgi:hypothetical protein
VAQGGAEVRESKALHVVPWLIFFRLHISLKITAVLGLLKTVISPAKLKLWVAIEI